MRKTCYVYAVSSVVANYIYVGISFNPTERIRQHNHGKEKTTRLYKPFKILLIEEFEDRMEARKREKYLKSGCGKELLKKIKELNVPGWRNW